MKTLFRVVTWCMRHGIGKCRQDFINRHWLSLGIVHFCVSKKQITRIHFGLIAYG